MPRRLGQRNREIEARKMGVLQNNTSTTGASRIIPVWRADKSKYFYLDVPAGETFLKVSTGATPGATNLLEIDETGEMKVTFEDSAGSVGAVLTLHGTYSTPGDGDVNGLIRVRGRSDTGADPIIADVYFTNEDVTNGNELGNISIVLQEGGGDVMPMRLKGNDVLIGAGSTLTTTPDRELDVRGAVQINQGAADDEIIEFQSSDVTHGITDVADTDTYGRVLKLIAASGGTWLEGLSETTQALQLTGSATGGNTARSTSAVGAVAIQARKKSGTGTADMGTNENLLVIYNRLTARALFDAEGDLHLDATSNINAWDEYDDVGLLAGLRASVMPEDALNRVGEEFLEYARPILEKTGVVTYNEDGHHFVSMKKLQWLQIDALRQMKAKFEERENRMMAKIEALEGKLAQLEAGASA